jgi:DNA polymerase-3 subunit beta
MKFTVKKSDVLNVLSQVQGLTGRKTSLAITTNILIETTGSGITLRATDLETGYDGVFPAQVDTDGSIAVNARKVFEIVRDFPSEDIHFAEIENHWIEIGNQNVEYHLVGMNTEDFPEIPKFEDIDFSEIDAGELNRMIERTVYVTGSSDDRRAHIIGIFLESLKNDTQNVLRMVSTDGSRLAKADGVHTRDFGLPAGEGVLVPKKGMYEVGKFLDDAVPVKIGLKNSNLVIKKENETLIIRLLEGEFPQYTDIIQQSDEAHEFKLDRRLFLMMLKRMSILSTEDYRSVKFNFTGDTFIITSTNPDIGESKEEMPVQFEGAPIEAAFNPRYFIEALNVIDTEKIRLALVDDEKPCILTGDGEQNFLTVIMPMRI